MSARERVREGDKDGKRGQGRAARWREPRILSSANLLRISLFWRIKKGILWLIQTEISGILFFSVPHSTVYCLFNTNH